MGLVITLVTAGVLLLLLETILPGVVAGVAGLFCLVAGVWVAYSSHGPQVGNIVLLCATGGFVAGAILWIKFFPGSRMARPFISKSVVGDVNTTRPELLRQTGVAHSALRPSGVAVINGRRVDVITEGAMVSPGAPVQVVKVEGLRVVVRPL
jgi:membrane-bound serine protease (ClpP class)